MRSASGSRIWSLRYRRGSPAHCARRPPWSTSTAIADPLAGCRPPRGVEHGGAAERGDDQHESEEQEWRRPDDHQGDAGDHRNEEHQGVDREADEPSAERCKVRMEVDPALGDDLGDLDAFGTFDVGRLRQGGADRGDRRDRVVLLGDALEEVCEFVVLARRSPERAAATGWWWWRQAPRGMRRVAGGTALPTAAGRWWWRWHGGSGCSRRGRGWRWRRWRRGGGGDAVVSGRRRWWWRGRRWWWRRTARECEV